MTSSDEESESETTVFLLVLLLNEQHIPFRQTPIQSLRSLIRHRNKKKREFKRQTDATDCTIQSNIMNQLAQWSHVCLVFDEILGSTPESG
jgi:hypothetical protein